MRQLRKGMSLDSVQTFNRSVMLSAIHQLGVCSRKEISDKTGLDQATVTRVLTPLIESEVVEEVGLSTGTGRGRRSINLQLSGRRLRIISIRLKRLSLAIAMFDLLGNQIAGEEIAIPEAQEAAESFAHLTRIVDAYMEAANGEVLGIGVALPGPFLQRDERIILMTESSSHWEQFNLVHELRQRYPDNEIFSSHDAKVAALAAWRGANPANEAKVMLFVMLGQGVGSAIVVDGEVFQGSNGLAGELGHVSVDVHGPECMCGNRGCLELYTSTLALQRKVWAAIAQGAETSLARGAGIDEIVAAFHAGDPLAVAEVERLATYLAHSLVSCINFINPDLIVLGEAAAGFGGAFRRMIVEKLAERVLPSVWEDIRIELYDAEGDIAMIGSHLSVCQQTLLSQRVR